MSMTGKVLLGIIFVLAILWVILAGGVLEYNKQGSRAVQKLEKEKLALEAQVVEARAKHQSFIDKIANEQVATGEDTAVLETKRFAAQKLRADAIEAELRAKYELEDYRASQKNAEVNRDNRIAEEKDTRTDLDKLRAEVRKLKETHADLTAQLSKLRNEFLSSYRSSVSKVSHVPSAK